MFIDKVYCMEDIDIMWQMETGKEISNLLSSYDDYLKAKNDTR